MTFYATFGQGQYAGTLKDFYIRLEIDDIARNRAECREVAMATMNKHFPKWSNIYAPDQIDLHLFHRGCLACLDEHGNRLFSKEF